jgi:V/A-type H+-transporting ATPase subunit E
MSKEAIIEKIISDGQKKADAILLEAREKADEILADAASECKTYYDQSVYEMNKQVDDILARGKTVAELDAKKLQLGAKAQILETVFSSALDKLLALDKKALKGLLVGMLANAEDGDVVIISANEKDVLTEKDVKDFAAKKGIKLSLAKEFGDFKGGLMLRGNGIDKNFTFEVEIAMIRDEIEMNIAKELFA